MISTFKCQQLARHHKQRLGRTAGTLFELVLNFGELHLMLFSFLDLRSALLDYTIPPFDRFLVLIVIVNGWIFLRVRLRFGWFGLWRILGLCSSPYPALKG